MKKSVQRLHRVRTATWLQKSHPESLNVLERKLNKITSVLFEIVWLFLRIWLTQCIRTLQENIIVSTCQVSIRELLSRSTQISATLQMLLVKRSSNRLLNDAEFRSKSSLCETTLSAAAQSVLLSLRTQASSALTLEHLCLACTASARLAALSTCTTIRFCSPSSGRTTQS